MAILPLSTSASCSSITMTMRCWWSETHEGEMHTAPHVMQVGHQAERYPWNLMQVMHIADRMLQKMRESEVTMPSGDMSHWHMAIITFVKGPAPF